jgi:hypothetical protein
LGIIIIHERGIPFSSNLAVNKVPLLMGEELGTQP